MATLEEIYQQVTASDDEKTALAEAVKTPEGLHAFLSERGCDATPEEVAAFLKAQAAGGAEGELADEELDSVAGGCNDFEAFISIVGVGIACAVSAGISASRGSMTGPNGEILCSRS